MSYVCITKRFIDSNKKEQSSKVGNMSKLRSYLSTS